MKGKWIVVFMLILMCMVGSNAFAGEKVKFVLDAAPLTFMVSPDVDDFNIRRSGGYITEIEIIEGAVAWSPNVQAGIGFNAGEVIAIDFTVGVGHYYGGAAFDSTFTMEKISARFKLGRAVTLGPQVGLITFDNLEWLGDAQVNFSDSDGQVYGFAFTVGIDKISFSLSIERMDLDPFTVRTEGGWQASSNELDLSGTVINLGVRMRF
jgi:hypothetical protein